MRIKILCFLLLSFPHLLLSQVGTVPYIRYNDENGLSQIQITYILDDYRGKIWVGTKEGLNILDNGRFISSEENETLGRLFVCGMSKDRNGRVWYLDREGFHDERGNTWATKGVTYTVWDGFLFDKQNSLWFFNPNWARQQVFIQTKDRHYSINQIYPKLPKKFRQIIWSENSQKVILIGDNGIVYLVGDSSIDSLSIKLFPEDIQKSYLNKSLSFHVKGNGKTYMICLGRLYEFDAIKKTVILCHNFNHKSTVTFEIDDNNNLYYLQDDLLYKYDTLTKKTLSFGYKYHLPNHILLSRKNNSIYISSEEGLFQYYMGAAFSYLGEKEGVISPWSIVSEKNGTLWYASYGEGLFCWEANKKRFIEKLGYEKPIFMHEGKLDKAFYFGVTRDKSNNLLFPYNGYGVLKYDGQKFSLMNEVDYRNGVLAMAILEEKDRYILGCQNRIITMDKNGNTEVFWDSITIKNSFIRTIAQTPNGDIYVGGFGGWGVWKDRKKIVLKNSERKQDVGLALHCDYKGNIWAFGGIGVGLEHYIPAQNKLEKVLSNYCRRSVGFLGSIDSSYLLIGGSDGLYILDLQKYYKGGKQYVAKFSRKNGAIMGSECGQNGLYKENDSLFYFATNSAIMRLDASKLKKELKSLSWGIKNMIETGGMDSLYTNNSKYSSNWFHHFHNSFKIYLKNYQSHIYTVKYELFSLENGQDTRIQLAQSDSILISKLPPDKYRLVVYPELGYQGLLDTQPIVIEFEILTVWDFYKWLVFPTVIILMVLIVIVIKRLKAETAEESVKKNISDIKFQSYVAQLDPHFIKNGLANLRAIMSNGDEILASKLFSNLDGLLSMLSTNDFIWSLNKELLFIQKYLYIEKTRFYEFSFEISHNGTEKLLEEIMIPKTILQSLVNNAVKYGIESQKSKNGEIRIEFVALPNAVNIKVIDNGKGIKTMESKLNGSSQSGNERIQNLFMFFNQEYAVPLFLFHVNEITENDAITGFISEITIPIHFSYSKYYDKT